MPIGCAVQAFAGPFFKMVKPDQINMTVSEWADTYRVLSSESSAEPGRYETARTPYLKEIMDSLGPQDPCSRITFMKSSQVGATECANNWVGYVIDQVPGPFLIVYPTDKMIEKVNTQRFNPLFKSMPQLAEKISKKKSQSSTNTKYIKDFPGGLLILGGANAPTNFNSWPIRFILADEVDRFPQDCGGEGDPIELVDGRTKTFSRNKKQFFISTPVDEDTSIISKLFAESDQRYYHVPCPHCGGMQKLVFERLKWEPEKPESVYYQCAHCEEPIYEQYKGQMLAGGEWIPTKPQVKKHKGYRINALYSPPGWESWVDIVTKWINIQKTKDTDKLKTFVNTILGETWKQRGETPEWENVYSKRENYQTGIVPKGALVLTTGVDIQRDRIELETVGWGTNQESWSVDYKVFKGDTSQKEVWEMLKRYIRRTLPMAEGGRMPITKIAIDSGDQTQMVYRFVRDLGDSRVVAVKGVDNGVSIVGNPRRVDMRDGKRILEHKAIEFYPIAVNIVKDELYARLHLKPPPTKKEVYPFGYCHFPDYDQEFFKQLTSEVKQRIFKKGKKRVEWKKIRDRNEALDCRVYARAAAAMYDIDNFTDEDWQDIRFSLIDNRQKYESKEEFSDEELDLGDELTINPNRRKSSYWN